MAAALLMLVGLVIFAWPKIDEMVGQWSQHGLAVAGDSSTTRYAWAVADAYDELTKTFEDSVVSFEVGALPTGVLGEVLVADGRSTASLRATDSRLESATGDVNPGSETDEIEPQASAPVVPAFPGSVIRIPSIGVNQAVVEGVSRSDLRLGPGHFPGTSQPGQPGNMVISGHRTTFTKPFYDLDQLSPGDAIVIDTPAGSFRYLVESTSVVDPTDMRPLQASSEAILTLTTCTPKGSASHRMVVRATFRAGAGG